MNTRLLLLLIFLLVLTHGSDRKVEEPKAHPPQEEIRTRPAPNIYKRRRMLAAEPLKIGIIDTGLDLTRAKNAKLCSSGHKSFVDNKGEPDLSSTDLIPTDEHGHGTNIAGIIAEQAGDLNYCLVILKFYSPRVLGVDNLENEIAAIKHATNIGVKVLNISGGGKEESEKEAKAIKAFIDAGGTVIAAAGNERADMEKEPFFPAMSDKRVISVGGTCKGKRMAMSNYGKPITTTEEGCNVQGFGITMSGTSQATAVHTAKIIKQMLDNVSK